MFDVLTWLLTMIVELHEAILKACVGHAGMLVGVASASGLCYVKEANVLKMRNT